LWDAKLAAAISLASAVKVLEAMGEKRP